MKKLILPIATLISLIFFAGSVNAQNYEVCKEKMQSIQDKCDKSFEECNNPCKSLTGTAWGPCYSACVRAKDDCYQRSVSPYNECLEEETTEDQENSTQPDQSQSDQSTREEKPGQDTNPVQAINDWIKDTFSDLDFEAIEAESLYGRTPQMTEEIIKKAQEEWEKMVNPDTSETTSPYTLDILHGQIQIKLPGQNEWSDLKQGDRIPPGSTIFTGMDTTTVLSIRDKGVVQVLPFTEITVSEEGLSEPGKTTTDIDLRTGEIELNIEGGVYTGSLIQVITTNAVAGVRGTRFWVSYNKDKKLSTVGVYEGTVEVTTKDGKTRQITPNGDKPGVVVVAQKLSVVKLILAGLVLIAVIAGSIFFIKRRGNKTFRSKKKR